MRWGLKCTLAGLWLALLISCILWDAKGLTSSGEGGDYYDFDFDEKENEYPVASSPAQSSDQVVPNVDSPPSSRPPSVVDMEVGGEQLTYPMLKETYDGKFPFATFLVTLLTYFGVYGVPKSKWSGIMFLALVGKARQYVTNVLKGQMPGSVQWEEFIRIMKKGPFVLSESQMVIRDTLSKMKFTGKDWCTHVTSFNAWIGKASNMDGFTKCWLFISSLPVPFRAKLFTDALNKEWQDLHALQVYAGNLFRSAGDALLDPAPSSAAASGFKKRRRFDKHGNASTADQVVGEKHEQGKQVKCWACGEIGHRKAACPMHDGQEKGQVGSWAELSVCSSQSSCSHYAFSHGYVFT